MYLQEPTTPLPLKKKYRKKCCKSIKAVDDRVAEFMAMETAKVAFCVVEGIRDIAIGHRKSDRIDIEDKIEEWLSSRNVYRHHPDCKLQEHNESIRDILYSKCSLQNIPIKPLMMDELKDKDFAEAFSGSKIGERRSKMMSTSDLSSPMMSPLASPVRRSNLSRPKELALCMSAFSIKYGKSDFIPEENDQPRTDMQHVMIPERSVDKSSACYYHKAESCNYEA